IAAQVTVPGSSWVRPASAIVSTGSRAACAAATTSSSASAESTRSTTFGWPSASQAERRGDPTAVSVAATAAWATCAAALPRPIPRSARTTIASFTRRSCTYGPFGAAQTGNMRMIGEGWGDLGRQNRMGFGKMEDPTYPRGARVSEHAGDALAQEREALRATVRTMLERTSSEAEVRRHMETETGYDEAVWKQAAEGLGLTGLAIPEEYGGSGFGPLELAVVFEEAGRSLYGGPFLATVGLAASALLASGDDAAKKEWLPGIAAGTTTATLALTEESSAWTADAITTTATADGDGARVSGVKWYVLDGHTADLILVVARTNNGVGLFAVTSDAAGLTREP